MATPSYPRSSSTSDTVRIVYLQIAGGTVYWLSPGCTVTQTVSKHVTEGGKDDGETYLYSIPTGNTHTIRIDAIVAVSIGDDVSDGINNFPCFDPAEMIYDVMKCETPSEAVLTWRGGVYRGIVKSVTVTQRSGEGNLLDVAITFSVGDVAGS